MNWNHSVAYVEEEIQEFVRIIYIISFFLFWLSHPFKDGAYFLDRSPVMFGILIDFLRSNYLENMPEKDLLKLQGVSHKKNFMSIPKLCFFYGVKSICSFDPLKIASDW